MREEKTAQELYPGLIQIGQTCHKCQQVRTISGNSVVCGCEPAPECVRGSERTMPPAQAYSTGEDAQGRNRDEFRQATREWATWRNFWMSALLCASVTALVGLGIGLWLAFGHRGGR